MKGISSELLMLLLFGAFMVFNIVMQRAAKKRQAEAGPEVLEDEAFEALEEAERQEAFVTPTPVSARFAAPAKTTVAVAPPARRRFSRQALFGNRRAAQNAFVVATILGPCRADQPHDLR